VFSEAVEVAVALSRLTSALAVMVVEGLELLELLTLVAVAVELWKIALELLVVAVLLFCVIQTLTQSLLAQV
jgi:hypothetical protein